MTTPYYDKELDLILGSLANMKRRRIIHHLSLQPSTIKQLADAHNLSLPAIDKHISNLENSMLIIRKKSGRTNFIALNQNTLGIAKNYLAQYKTEWGNMNASLDNYIARMKQ